MYVNWEEKHYRARNKGVQISLSNSQAGPGRTVKQEQEEISPNHVQRINLISVLLLRNHIVIEVCPDVEL